MSLEALFSEFSTFLSVLLNQAWTWLAATGLALAIIVVLGFLVPRAGRFIKRRIAHRVKDEEDEEAKNTLAITGVLIYIGQILAYFILFVLFLQQLGFSLAGAAIPATVASAAIGFGAQSIIADFVAGFFLLTERQYGVGDWVRFVGNGIDVEGTVIQVTMRATQIRTLAQETVVIPNSTARVSINASNYWSRAVIVIPVPLLGSESPADAARRTEEAARRALAQSDIKDTLIGELEFQPAVNINPPSTVGMPWTVDIRIMIQVDPGAQWAAERAVRMAILDEFWEEYGSATTTTGKLSQHLVSTAEVTEVNTAALRSSSFSAEHDNEPDPEEDPAALSTGQFEAAISTSEKNSEPEDSLSNVVTAGGRIRKSTAGLIIGLFALILLRLLTISGETLGGEMGTGILAPPPLSSPAEPTYQEPAPIEEIPSTQSPSPTPLNSQETLESSSAEQTTDNTESTANQTPSPSPSTSSEPTEQESTSTSAPMN